MAAKRTVQRVGGDIAVDEVLVHGGADLLHAAIIVEGRLEDFVTEKRHGEGVAGSIHLGRVVRHLPGMGGAFVEIGLARPALLDVKKRVLTEGALVPVQVVEAAVGDKAARVGLRLALPGRFAVLLPGGSGAAPSRRLDPSVARRLAAWADMVPPGYGLLWRWTAGLATAEELTAEVQRLAVAWTRIEAARESASRPRLLHDDGEGARRLLREFGGRGRPRFVFDDEAAARAAAGAAREWFPDIEDRIEMTRSAPGRPEILFDRYDIASARASASAARVELASGGRIHIEPTAALTAIDVDSAAASADPRARLSTNLEAAREIARQIRLRDLGGIVAIDFLRHPEAQSRARVLDELVRAVAPDRVAVDVLGFTRGGLVELVRPRVRAGEGAA